MEFTDAIITGDILKQKASAFWQALPQYTYLPEPKWSNGWLYGFKTRFKIIEYVLHGEAASNGTLDPEMIQQMADLPYGASAPILIKQRSIFISVPGRLNIGQRADTYHSKSHHKTDINWSKADI